MKPKFSDAILALIPEAEFVSSSSEILNWYSEKAKPTKSAIESKLTELQADFESKQYQRDRKLNYPSYADQLDTIYHKGLDAWKAEIKTVKDKYPKP